MLYVRWYFDFFLSRSTIDNWSLPRLEYIWLDLTRVVLSGHPLSVLYVYYAIDASLVLSLPASGVLFLMVN